MGTVWSNLLSADLQSTAFGCNLEAVEATAASLRLVLDELKNFSNRDDFYAASLASNDIRQALEDFSSDSSDHRDKITGSVDALAAMLEGVASGVREVDRALAGSIPDVPEQVEAAAPSGSNPSSERPPNTDRGRIP